MKGNLFVGRRRSSKEQKERRQIEGAAEGASEEKTCVRFMVCLRAVSGPTQKKRSGHELPPGQCCHNSVPKFFFANSVPSSQNFS